VQFGSWRSCQTCRFQNSTPQSPALLKTLRVHINTYHALALSVSSSDVENKGPNLTFACCVRLMLFRSSTLAHRARHVDGRLILTTHQSLERNNSGGCLDLDLVSEEDLYADLTIIAGGDGAGVESLLVTLRVLRH
jgi:hypothetical protein